MGHNYSESRTGGENATETGVSADHLGHQAVYVKSYIKKVENTNDENTNDVAPQQQYVQ